jgi:hypothetical protein
MDAAPSSLASMSTYETFLPQKVFLAETLRFSNKRMFDGVQMKKIRCGPVAGDLQLYDCGSLSIATNNCASTSAIGDVWVSYDIELISPQTEPSTPVSSRFAVFNLSANMSLTSTVQAPITFDEEVVNGLEITNTSGVLTLPCGTFRVRADLSILDSSAEAFSVNAYCYVDGVAKTPIPCQASGKNSVGAALYIGWETYVVSDGSTTVEAQVTATGAAGTLNAAQDQCRLIVQVV